MDISALITQLGGLVEIRPSFQAAPVLAEALVVVDVGMLRLSLSAVQVAM
jgi:hypothetical protein